ncbi:unnamed protein product [Brassica rapa]|uniref:Uncharacterized protein n=2 Tax=Brassica TaxID=3705 RepID=A0A8D9D068_BRACM|nr:unnamed protein product [Brassica rapa]
MENNQLSGQETILGGQYGSTLQVVSGDSTLIYQKLVEAQNNTKSWTLTRWKLVNIKSLEKKEE